MAFEDHNLKKKRFIPIQLNFGSSHILLIPQIPLELRRKLVLKETLRIKGSSLPVMAEWLLVGNNY